MEAALPESERHPTLLITHVIFKIGPIVLYLIIRIIFNSIFSSDQCTGLCTGMTFLVILMIAADFWFTKNVSGRFFVGLRWWNQIREDGSEKWIFESNEGKKNYHSSEKWIFWGTLFGATAFWAAYVILSIITISLSPTNFFIIMVGALLNGVNLMGFIKCARGARAEVQQQVQSYVVSQAVSGAVGGVTDSAEESE